MGHMLLLCSVGPSGDAFWERSAALSPADLGAKEAASLVGRLSSEILFPTERASNEHTSQDITTEIRKKLPAVRIDSLQIGIALGVAEPHALERRHAGKTRHRQAASGVLAIVACFHADGIRCRRC